MRWLRPNELKEGQSGVLLYIVSQQTAGAKLFPAVPRLLRAHIAAGGTRLPWRYLVTDGSRTAMRLQDSNPVTILSSKRISYIKSIQFTAFLYVFLKLTLLHYKT